MSGGNYYCTFDATDTGTVGNLTAFIHVSGALAVKCECEVLPANVYDSLFGGTDNLQVETVALAADTITAAATATDFTTEIQNGLATSSALATAQTGIDDLPTNAELATALGT